MANITELEKQNDLKLLESLLNDLDIPAQYYPPGNLFPEFCLMCILPTSYEPEEFRDSNPSEEELDGNDILAFSYIFQLEEEDNALTKQLLTYCMLNQSLSSLELPTLYRAVNALNLKMSSGYFTLETKEHEEPRLQYRFIMTVPVGSPFPDECFFQSLSEMTLAADTAMSMIDAMKKGISYEEFLNNPSAFLDSFSSEK